MTASCAPSDCSCSQADTPGTGRCPDCPADLARRARAFAAKEGRYEALVADAKARQGRRKPGAGTPENKQAGELWPQIADEAELTVYTAKNLVSVALAETGRGPIAKDVRPECLEDLGKVSSDALDAFARGRLKAGPCLDDVKRWCRPFLTPEAATKLASKASKKAERDRLLDVMTALRTAAVDDPSIHEEMDNRQTEKFRLAELDVLEARLSSLRRLPAHSMIRHEVAALLCAYLADDDRDLAAPPSSDDTDGTASPSSEAPELVKDRTGIAPTSYIRIPEARERRWRALVNDAGETREHAVAHPSEHGTVSIPSAFLTAHLTACYTEPDVLVLDPFAGGPTRAVVTTRLGRRYLGVDLRPEQVRVTQDRVDALDLSQRARVRTDDSTTFDWLAHIDGLAAASISCPPYFNLERYSDDPRDLSTASSYEAFLDMLGEVIDGLVPALAPGAFVAWIVGEVGDRAGETHDLPEGVRRLFRERGLIAHGKRFFERSQPPTGVGSFPKTKRAVRVHEEIVVMQVPEDGPSR